MCVCVCGGVVVRQYKSSVSRLMAVSFPDLIIV